MHLTDPVHDTSTHARQWELEALLDSARRVKDNASVPLSRFRVGSAVLTAHGRVFEGCNTESLIPVLGVCAVGKQMERNERYFLLATRVIAELGAHVVKTYYCEPGFEKIVAACPVPIVIAGGKKIPEKDALELAWKAIDCGAAGVDMGRNIFQAEDPVAMLKAVNAIVHGGENTSSAWQLYLEEKKR